MSPAKNPETDPLLEDSRQAADSRGSWPAVARFLRSEAGATMVWVFSSLILAAVIAPWIYQAGKSLAASPGREHWPALFEWFAASCERAKFGRFFDRSLLLSALLLLPLLWVYIKRLQSSAPPYPLTRLGFRTAAIQCLLGVVIAGGTLFLLGLVLDGIGSHHLKDAPLSGGKLLRKILLPAIAAPLIEEWLFRGLLLGMWLRFTKPAAACIGSSLVFAFLHFLQPPPGTVIAVPSNPLAGFELLGNILLHFTNPRFFLTDFATLMLVGLILAHVRLRTASLWFPIGLHAGWVAAFKAFNLLWDMSPGHPIHPWGIGDSLRSGLLPVVTLLASAWLCRIALSHPRVNPSSR